MREIPLRRRLYGTYAAERLLSMRRRRLQTLLSEFAGIKVHFAFSGGIKLNRISDKYSAKNGFKVFAENCFFFGEQSPKNAKKKLSFLLDVNKI